ncbi:hypothetical protein DB30_01535 [Enhygromyxa salina]|uniref:Peptidase C14 caspase domain-containing protein n=1 Tax=Enhygromyxa salina TaxID=215803 RepID=A0A0C2CM96_9BACT|nr:caspase family protein [Enhygromyxa salina]KIG12376.1 hypothetical protein DB30_01535 [Enhygromyxa salina]
MTAKPSTKRALLLGAPAKDLSGVEHDIELMTAALREHEFSNITSVCPATRDDIASALDQLVADTQPGDIVVFYYSGHGSKVEPPGAKLAGIGEDSYYRFLVPSDFPKSTEGNFRGFTNTELSVVLARLTKKSPNVTVIMDCCFAGRVFRKSEDDHAEEKIEWQDTSRYRPTRYHESKGRWARAASKYFETLRERGFGEDTRAAEANPHAVQLLASSANGKAYETPCNHSDCGHSAAGAMTLALHDVLSRIDPVHTTWQDVGRMIRMTPRRSGHDQLVSVEGPHRRFLFRLHEREELGAVDVDISSGRVHLVGGALADLRRGDRYELVSFGNRGNEEIAAACEVDAVSSSFATIKPRLGVERIASGTRARPIAFGESRGSVELRGFASEVEHELLEARIGAVGLTLSREPDPAGSAIACLRLADHKLQLFRGELGFDVPRAFQPGKLPLGARHLAQHIAEAAYRIGRANTLANLCGGRLDPECEPQLARVRADGLQELSEARPTLVDGEAISMIIEPRLDIHASVFCIHPNARIELLSRAQGGGVEIRARETYRLGQRSREERVRGIELRRPSRSILSTDAPLPFTIMVILTDKHVDLRSWEQRGVNRFSWTDPLKPPSFARNALGGARPTADALFRIYKFELDLAGADAPLSPDC